MYTTIEADIINGRVKSADLHRIPAEAHVLITLLPRPTHQKRPKTVHAANRKPDPTLRGSVKIGGDIMDSAPSSSWNLPL